MESTKTADYTKSSAWKLAVEMEKRQYTTKDRMELVEADRTARKAELLASLPTPTMTSNLSGYKLGCEVGRNEVIAEVIKELTK